MKRGINRPLIDSLHSEFFLQRMIDPFIIAAPITAHHCSKGVNPNILHFRALQQYPNNLLLTVPRMWGSYFSSPKPSPFPPMYISCQSSEQLKAIYYIKLLFPLSCNPFYHPLPLNVQISL